MQTIITPTNITLAIGLISIMFVVYRYFRDPQVVAEKTDALLEQQMKWSSDSTEKRFADMQSNFQQLLLQSNNHIHTVDTKVDTLKVMVNSLNASVVRLETIIDERVPKKRHRDVLD